YDACDSEGVETDNTGRERIAEVKEKEEVSVPGEVYVEEINISGGDEVPDGIVSEKYDPRLDLPHYEFPGLELLNDYSDRWYDISQAELQRNNMRITAALAEYKIQIQSIFARKGPTVTLYEIVPAPGTKVAQIKRIEEDIARSIGVHGVRVITLLNTIGIEVPNDRPSTVPMKSILNDPAFRNNKFELPIALGYTISQKVLAFDLTKAPHLLVAGATGMGKSVGLNAILTSLLYSKHPAELKLVLVDPKRVELSIYGAIKNHFLATLPGEEKPILTDTSKVVTTLKSLCMEMESRYELLEMAKERNIKDYNARFLDRKLNPNNGHKFLPYIVVVIDEFADLLITAGKEIEEPISRLAAKARAVGIHLIIATQRPTTDVITGTIKANFPSRIAFKVLSGVDSRTIIDDVGANRLIGRGDMLVMIAGQEMCRVQCAFVDTDEAIRISEFIGSQQGYGSPYYLPECDDESDISSVDLGKRDPLFDEAARLIVANQQGSTSLLQRKMEIGYNRAGRIMDQLEAAGIVGPSEGSKARKVLVLDFDQLDELLKTLD
ncbi:MAG: DNA translocase FtsK, partial [Muribaculum sp.]|nr:DNA translocase FtsK [Candidatus Merdivivens faecigallinarum]